MKKHAARLKKTDWRFLLFWAAALILCVAIWIGILYGLAALIK